MICNITRSTSCLYGGWCCPWLYLYIWLFQEQFENTKGIIRIVYHNTMAKQKRTDNDLQNMNMNLTKTWVHIWLFPDSYFVLIFFWISCIRRIWQQFLLLLSSSQPLILNCNIEQNNIIQFVRKIELFIIYSIDNLQRQTNIISLCHCNIYDVMMILEPSLTFTLPQINVGIVCKILK